MNIEQRETLSSNLLDAIKKDSVKAFGEVIQQDAECLFYTYGRYPVLSLCYLWDSWKIISKYESQLILIKEGLIEVDEDIPSYYRFKRHANRALRLYADSDRVVLPIEMLAILGKNIRLSRVIKKYGIEDKQVKRVERIYSMSRKQTATINGSNIHISKEKISVSKLCTIIICLVVSVIMIAASSLFLAHTFNLKQGTESNPFMISNSSQLDKMLSSEYYCKLADDIKVDAKGYKFSGNLDGNGHSLIIENAEISLFQELKGKICNVKLVISASTYIADDHLSPLVQYNDGIIENVEIDISNSTINVLNNLAENDENKTRYIGLICALNYGSITDTKVKVNGLNLVGSQKIDSTFGSITGCNMSTIKNCSTDEGNIDTNTIDIGGLVGENNGYIISCTNKANISQTTDSENWSPNIAGIAFKNNGSIENSINYGNITVNHTLDKEGLKISCTVGGISAANYATIYHCKNVGNINITVHGMQIVAGGIAGMNYAQVMGVTPLIQNCGSLSTITINNKGNNEQLVGGIVGYITGAQVLSSFTDVNIIDNNTETTLSFLGGIVGFARTGQSLSNYYVVKGTYFGFGGYAGYPEAVRPTSDEGLGTTQVASLEALEQTEVYW